MFTPNQNSLRDVSTKGKGYCVFNTKENIVKKINFSLIIPFCLIGYNVSIDSFWVHLVLEENQLFIQKLLGEVIFNFKGKKLPS